MSSGLDSHLTYSQVILSGHTALMKAVRDIGARGADALPVTVAADGEVSVGPEPIGHLAGFDFKVDPTARHADKRLLLAAAERRLGDEAAGGGEGRHSAGPADRCPVDVDLVVVIPAGHPPMMPAADPDPADADAVGHGGRGGCPRSR